MKKEDNPYTIHTSIDNTTAELVRLVCTNCGGGLTLTDKTHAICPYCGQTFLVDEAKGTVININIDYEDVGEVKKTISSTKKMLVVFLVIMIIIVLGILGVNLAANFSVLSSSDRDAAFEENGELLAIFCKDIFGKEYKDITDEEFAGIRYIRYDSDRDVNDGFHVIRYSFTNYEDCESEEAFQDTIETWTYHSSKASWPSDFTMFTGLTRIDNSNSLWLSQMKYSKKAKISFIETSESLKNVTACFEPEYVRVLHMGAQNGSLEGIGEYKNLEEIVADGYPGPDGTLDITGIGNCTRLRKIYLKSGTVSAGLEELEKLDSVRSLYVSGAKLKDSAFLEKMPKLEELSTEIGESGDVSMLDSVSGLKKLFFMDNGEVEIESLLELKQLEEVNLDIDQEEQLQKLQKLTSLKVLDLRLKIFGRAGNPVDVSKLAGMPKLERLTIEDFWGNGITGMESVFNKPGMKEISIGDGGISPDMTKLFLNPGLLEDNLSVEKVRMTGWISAKDSRKEGDFDILLHYPNLKKLDLGGSGINDISFLAAFQNLEVIDLQENEITDYSPLDSCKKLKRIYIFGNPEKEPVFSRNIQVYTEPHVGSL